MADKTTFIKKILSVPPEERTDLLKSMRVSDRNKLPIEVKQTSADLIDQKSPQEPITN